MGSSGWATPHWPTSAFGRGLSPVDAVTVRTLLREVGALGPPGGLGLLLAGPTIYTHGTEEQQRRFLPDIVAGRVAWCQLFSEPAAGSDLAGMQTRAVRDGDVWSVSGQKVWTSDALRADMAMLVARTDPDRPKRRGLTYFLLEMDQPGVEVRPLREMTGRSLFNEVFLTDVQVPHENVLGGVDDGWTVANTTLMFERSGLGAGSAGAGASDAVPGSHSEDLDRRAGDCIRPAANQSISSLGIDVLIELARRSGKLADPGVRQRLAPLHMEHDISRCLAQRNRDLAPRGGVPGMGNIAKLRTSEIARQTRELGIQILGPRAMLHDYESPAADGDLEAAVTSFCLFSPAISIYGGTDEIQRNILAERVLDLPRDEIDDRSIPFRDLPKNV